MRPITSREAVNWFLQGSDSSRDGLKWQWYWAVLVALIVAGAYVGLVVTLDNTNLGTTNGLWKTPMVSAWGRGAHDPLDNGEFFYPVTYGHLTHLLPDSFFQYGVPAPEVTFRKMAMLNALFGGMASGLFFLLACRFTGSRLTAAALALLHAGAGFVLLNSINSEDIIPAYTFLLGSMVCWFEFLYRGSKTPLVLSALFLALATLFHWTVMAPALAAFVAAYAFLARKQKTFLRIAAFWFCLFLVFIQALLFLVLPKLHISLWMVLLPAKADAGGWLGLFAEKFWYLLIGMGNYFSGAMNLTDYKAALGKRPILYSMIISWAYLAVTLSVCVIALLRKSSREEKVLAIFAIVLFAVGEAGAVYSQPQDPQMQVEPMFATMAGAMLLVGRGRLATVPRSWVAGLLAVAAAANGAWNIHLMRASAGQDSEALAAIDEMERLFPRDRTIMVCIGWEGWTAWQYVVAWRGDSQRFLDSEVHLARPFTLNRGIDGVAAAKIAAQQIDAARQRGFRVVAAALWTESPDQMISSLTTVTTGAQAKTYDTILRKEYRTGTHWNTRVGPFVEILPATPLSP